MMGNAKLNPEVIVNRGGRREGGFEWVEGGMRLLFSVEASWDKDKQIYCVTL